MYTSTDQGPEKVTMIKCCMIFCDTCYMSYFRWIIPWFESFCHLRWLRSQVRSGQVKKDQILNLQFLSKIHHSRPVLPEKPSGVICFAVRCLETSKNVIEKVNITSYTNWTIKTSKMKIGARNKAWLLLVGMSLTYVHSFFENLKIAY